MYAIVRSGGRQHKVAVGDILEVNRLGGLSGSTVTLPPVLVVDDDTITSGGNVTRFQVSGEIVEHSKGPKIDILKYKNKTGYRKRAGHRQQLTRVKITGIDTK